MATSTENNNPRNRQGFNTNVKKTKTSAPPTINANDGSNRGFTIGILALVVLGLGAIAFLAANRESDISNAPQVAEVEVDGSPIIGYPRESGAAVTNASNDAAVGNPAPVLRGTSFDDSPVVIEGDGTPKAVYFLAHHCPFCQEEVKVVQNLIDTGQQPEGMEVVAVSTSVLDEPNRNYPPETWLKREGFTPATMRDSDLNNAFNAYGGSSFPYVVYLDGDNNVVARSAGQLDESITLSLWQTLAQGGAAEGVEGDGSNQSDADAEPVDTPDPEPEGEDPEGEE